MVLNAVSVNRDFIVGAHSLINSDLPNFSVAVGVPAQIIRNRKDWVVLRVTACI
jgi:serine acetyltransferase